MTPPFEKNIYINSLIYGGAKTLYGEKIIESITPPKIEVINLIKDTSFNLGVALSAVQVCKISNFELVNSLLYKSFFYSLRNLISFKTGKLVNGYTNIYKASETIIIPLEYHELLENCYKLRENIITKIDSILFYKNISFISKYVMEQLEN